MIAYSSNTFSIDLIFVIEFWLELGYVLIWFTLLLTNVFWFSLSLLITLGDINPFDWSTFYCYNFIEFYLDYVFYYYYFRFG